ncbi:hypothetical protein BDZ45DRAFT_735945 [Acephala macrosclerotiorum]|nr:hypothetical protein BDZ45DRAFT_735945 [Acephala macrosclerotiorum]
MSWHLTIAGRLSINRRRQHPSDPTQTRALAKSESSNYQHRSNQAQTQQSAKSTPILKPPFHPSPPLTAQADNRQQTYSLSTSSTTKQYTNTLPITPKPQPIPKPRRNNHAAPEVMNLA